MTPRPLLRRSVTFWSGIVVMAFICWAWRVSYEYGSFASYDRAMVEQARGYVSVARSWDTAGISFDHSPLRPGQYDHELAPPPFYLEGQGKSLPPPFTGPVTVRTALEWSYMKKPTDCFGVFVPHWLILIAVALPWLALLFWRARRGKPPTIAEPNS
jgi:hypothetical protein